MRSKSLTNPAVNKYQGKDNFSARVPGGGAMGREKERTSRAVVASMSWPAAFPFPGGNSFRREVIVDRQHTGGEK
jgi:hypothetical protein